MLNEKIKRLIEDKSNDLNNKSFSVSEKVADIIHKLNGYIDEKITLSDSKLESCIIELVGYFTTSFYIPISPGLKILRAVKRQSDADNTTELSYIPSDVSIPKNIGRMNRSGVSRYYGCIYFNDVNGGINIGFSEINSEQKHLVNILRSTTVKELNVYYIGIYDFVRRQKQPDFIPHEVFDYFAKIYSYQNEKYTDDVFLAHQLCDAFFADILRRKKQDNLYLVTSILSDQFLEEDNIDGLIYTSVQSEDRPLIVIKPTSVDEKIIHTGADSFRIEYDFGYAFYRAVHLDQGTIEGKKINWQSKKCHNNYKSEVCS